MATTDACSLLLTAEVATSGVEGTGGAGRDGEGGKDGAAAEDLTAATGLEGADAPSAVGADDCVFAGVVVTSLPLLLLLRPSSRSTCALNIRSASVATVIAALASMKVAAAEGERVSSGSS